MDTTINLKHAIEQLVKEKGIDRQVVLEAMEQAVLTAANKKYRNTRDLEAHYNPAQCSLSPKSAVQCYVRQYTYLP